MAKRSFYIKDSELDDYQVRVINKKSEKSFIVKGCAGSGKSILALWKAKQIQDETYDGILHVVSEDAFEAKQFLIRNKSSFEESRYFELAALIEKDIERTSSDYLTRRLLVSKYSEFQNFPSLTGGIELDIDKICNMVAFFASHCVGLFKVKLMKLLWYTFI